jgi:hypothetical protein
MFDWLRGALKGRPQDPPGPPGLAEKKLEMDQTFHFRPWAVFPVEKAFEADLGAFVEDAVTEDDFHGPMEGLLEEIFYREEEDS